MCVCVCHNRETKGRVPLEAPQVGSMAGGSREQLCRLPENRAKCTNQRGWLEQAKSTAMGFGWSRLAEWVLCHPRAMVEVPVVAL